MNTSLPALVACLLALFFSEKTGAQEKVDQTIADLKNGTVLPPEKRAAELDAMMRDGLSLTGEQSPVVHEINLRYAQRTEEEVVRPALGNWSKYWKLRSIQQDKDAELERALTPDQFKKYATARDAALWKGVRAILF